MRTAVVVGVLTCITLSACGGASTSNVSPASSAGATTSGSAGSGTSNASSNGTSTSAKTSGTGSGATTGSGASTTSGNTSGSAGSAGTSASTSGSASSSGSAGSGAGGSNTTGSNNAGSNTTGSNTANSGFVSFADNLPAAGSSGKDLIPTGAEAEDTSHPDQVIGNGSAASCTSAAVVAAVATGGTITFNCGPAPVTIQMTATAQIFNNTASTTVIDGGGRITLSGMGQRRILYMNTCDQNLVWTTPHCDNQEYPQLTVQNITLVDGNASSEVIPEGGAIYARGGRLKVVNARFFSNVCASSGPDTAGGAIYANEEYNGLPVYIVHTTFGGQASLSNVCSNGGALGSIGVSWTLINSLLSYNHAVGNGGNPAQSGTPGGGSGGAIYNDGDTMVLTLNGSQLSSNQVNAYGSAVFFVSDDHTGSMAITDSTITGNLGGSWYPAYPQISAFPDTPIVVTNSNITD